MKEAAVLALQQKAVSPVLAAVLPMAPELAKSLVGPICDTIRTCVCKDQIVQQELYKTWAKIAPQCLEQFGAFMTLMGQIVDASKEYDKLTVHQVDLVIDKICSEPNVPFPEKQEAIRAIIQQQYEHHERLGDKAVSAAKFGAGAAAVGTVGVAGKKGLEAGLRYLENRDKLLARTSIIQSFSPAGVIKAVGDVIRIIKK